MMLGVSSGVIARTPIPAPDPGCVKVANFGKSIETIKEVGINEKEFQSYISAPTVQTFPINAIKDYVFQQNATNPQQVYDLMMEKCTFLGYDKVLEFFLREEDYLKLQKQNLDLQVKIDDLQKQNVAQSNKIKELEDTVLKKHIRKKL